MRLHDFIFSDRPNVVLLRHGSFWLARFIFLLVNYNLVLLLVSDGLSLASLALITGRSLFALAIEMAFTYSAIYWILPWLRSKENKLLLVASLTCYSLLFFGFQLAVGIAAGSIVFTDNLFPFQLWSRFWGFISYGPFAMAAIFFVTRSIKEYFRALTRKNDLMQANTEAEIRLLKSQLHPHFLFNALNLVYSYALKQSPRLSAAVHQLHDMMHYMINDCSSDLVPLEKELHMINGYIELQNGRYGDRLTMEKNISGNLSGLQIAPQLLLPCVENSYKHGPAQCRGRQWIRLNIAVKQNRLDLCIENSLNEDAAPSPRKSGIGMANLKRRLDLVYSGNYSLEVQSLPTRYSLSLQLALNHE